MSVGPPARVRRVVVQLPRPRDPRSTRPVPRVGPRPVVRLSRPPPSASAPQISPSRWSASASSGRVVEHQRGRQRAADGRADGVAQFHGEQRIEAEVAERRARIDRARSVEAQHLERTLAHEAREQRARRAGGACGELPAQVDRPAAAAPGAPRAPRPPRRRGSARKGGNAGPGNVGRKRGQSTGSTPTCASLPAQALEQRLHAGAGEMRRDALGRHALATPRSTAAPTSDQAPQLMLAPAGRARSRASRASASRKAFAAAWLPCPAEPSTAAIDEKSTKKSSGTLRVSVCRACHAPATLAAKHGAKRCGQSC